MSAMAMLRHSGLRRATSAQLAEFSADDPCIQLRESGGVKFATFSSLPTMNWTRPIELFLEVALGIWLLDKILKAVKEKSRS
jgi:hypothetical protein